jgi:hypothetical protein
MSETVTWVTSPPEVVKEWPKEVSQSVIGALPELRSRAVIVPMLAA